MKKIILISFIILIALTKAYCQKEDFAFWPGMKVSKNITKRWTTDLFVQARFSDNATFASNIFFDAGLKYKLSNHFRLGVDYVFVSQRSHKNPQSIGHQVYAEISYKTQYRKFKFNYKLIYQVQYQDVYSSEKGRIPGNYFRNKFQFDYNMSKLLDPFVYFEPRILIMPNGFLLYNRFRVGGGFHIKLNYHNQLDVYFLFQNNFNEGIPNKTYILGMNYNIMFF